MTAAAETVSLHDTVTNRIIRELEQGRFPWVQPWASSGGRRLACRRTLRRANLFGVNILLLWFAAIEQGRPSQRWLTFKQALALGGNAVRKGEKGTMVVYADTFVPKAEQEKASASGRGSPPRRLPQTLHCLSCASSAMGCRRSRCRASSGSLRGPAACRSCHRGDRR
jgi:antirestriction protein ArdC